MTPNPVVVITGATKGIGLALTERFAPAASQLHLVARSHEDLAALAARLKRPGLEVCTYACDLSDKDQTKRLVTALTAALEQLDVLINNAGLYLPGEVVSEPDANLEYMMRLNVFAQYYLTRGLVDRMAGHGHVFAMASVASRKMFADKPSYSITKHAQLALTDALRTELHPQGIRVTAILPGPTWSASWEGADFPTDRLLQAEHVAEMVWQVWNLPQGAVVEELVIRPQLGDLD
ncbi:MAG TPA: short-chain dehydrogenase [Deltaproteobacteria bacterium]|nr:short-chain dehydrogenase [Deltaproteobacteria bacterium]